MAKEPILSEKNTIRGLEESVYDAGFFLKSWISRRDHASRGVRELAEGCRADAAKMLKDLGHLPDGYQMILRAGTKGFDLGPGKDSQQTLPVRPQEGDEFIVAPEITMEGRQKTIGAVVLHNGHTPITMTLESFAVALSSGSQLILAGPGEVTAKSASPK